LFRASLALGRDCLLCAARTRNNALCGGCRRNLPYLPSLCCPSCALPTFDGAVCGACLKRPPKFDRAFGAFSYAHPIDCLIQKLKYRGRLELVRLLGEGLGDRLVASPRPHLIVPAPLHAARIKQRGFNQALELAREIGKRLNVPVDAVACTKVRATAPQTDLPYAERAKNVRGAFTCKADFSGRHVAVLDDVMTTGATLNEISRVLKQAGAMEVSAWVVARSIKD
jgi:ComF family protein